MADGLRLCDLRFGFLIVALVCYALCGSPTPDNPGWVEAVVGGLLILAAGMPVHLFLRGRDDLRALRIFFLYGLTVPLAGAILRGPDLVLLVRDVIAFLFLCLPLFFLPLLQKDSRYLKFFVSALILCALCFSLRALAPAHGMSIASTERLYLANSPLVLFAAIYLSGMAGYGLCYRRFPFNLAPASLWALLTIPLFLAMLMDVQRATVAGLAVSLAALFVIGVTKHPRRMILPGLILAACGYYFYPQLADIAHHIVQKTAQVGLNMRVQEMNAVLDAVGKSPLNVLFGLGWGATFPSPAVGGVEVNFTHSLLTYLLLKTGVIGLILGLGYIVMTLRQIVRLFRGRPLESLAILWPVLIPVFLYASHKSLDFGLILLLCWMWAQAYCIPKTPRVDL